MNANQKPAAFSVTFDADGNPIDILPLNGCELVSEKEATPRNLTALLDHIEKEFDEHKVSTVGCGLIHVHSSPGCYILTASGRLKCVCCR